MIRLVPPLSLDGRFSATDLPDELHLPLLNNMVTPRIVSSSMTPTIQAGDQLELGPPTVLTIGTIVVFRTGTLLVCHRVTAIDEQGMLSTKGDATAGIGESVQPDAVIGVVTGVIRESTHISMAEHPGKCLTPTHTASLSHLIRKGLARSIGWIIGVLGKVPLVQNMLSLLFRKAARVDVLIPAPLRSLPSHSTVTSFKLQECHDTARLMAVSHRQQPTQYVVRLGPWRLAQYHPITGVILLRQSLKDAGLEPFIRQCCGAPKTPPP